MNLKRTIVLATDAFINNLDVLGSSFMLNDGTMVYTHRDPKVAVHGTEVSFNFDILINSKKVINGYNFGEILPWQRFIHMPRENKFTQAVMLNQAAKQFATTTNFIPVPVWCVTMGEQNHPAVEGHVIIKPLNGARGIGHFTVDTSKVNINTALRAISEAGDNTKVSILKALEEFAGAVEPHWGSENFEGEGVNMLKTDGVLMQSLIPGVVAEYRVITDHTGTPVYFQKRKIKDPDSRLPQATGGGSLINVDIESCKVNPFVNKRINNSVISGEISEAGKLFDFLCKNVIGPLNSIDLFFTDNGWGIFEYCNQFGITGIPNSVARELHLNFIQSLVDNYLALVDGPDPEKTVNRIMDAVKDSRKHPLT